MSAAILALLLTLAALLTPGHLPALVAGVLAFAAAIVAVELTKRRKKSDQPAHPLILKWAYAIGLASMLLSGGIVLRAAYFLIF